MTKQYKIMFGQKVWPASYLKPYAPFYMGMTVAFFGFAYIHTILMNDPEDKWSKIMEKGRENTEHSKKLKEAMDYLEKQRSTQ
jgi:hypothetical protein